MSVRNISNDNCEPARFCPRCGGFGLVPCETTTSIWTGETPFVIERIPALRCADCDEVLIDRATADRLTRIGQAPMRAHRAVRKIEVPVIAYPQFST